MTLQGFVIKNALRNPRRTFLTVMSIAISLAMIVILRSVLLELVNPTGLNESLPRIVVRHRTSLTMSLPDNYEEKIVKLPGVQAVTPLNWFGGKFKTDDNSVNFFPRFAVDPDTFFDVFIDVKPGSPEQLEVFKTERTACLIGEKTMKSLGLKIGDRIVLTGDIFPVDPELTIRGTYSGPDPTWLVFQRKYLDELLGETARAGTFFVLADSPDNVPSVLNELEETFRNAESQVKAETEKAFQLSFVEMLGNIKVLFGALISVVVFAVTLIAASTMAMAMRERTREVAVLKTIGYERTQITVIMLAEGLFVSAAGGLLGVGGAWLLLPQPRWFMIVAAGVMVAAVLGLLLLLATMLLPETGAFEGEMTKAARANKFLTQWGPKAAMLIGLAVSLLLMAKLPPMDWITVSGGFVPYMNVRPETVTFGISIAFIVGVASSLLPAFGASRVSVIEGIRNLG